MDKENKSKLNIEGGFSQTGIEEYVWVHVNMEKPINS